jgi:hypothetical protein
MKQLFLFSLLAVLVACDPIAKKIEEEPKISFNNLVISGLETSDIYNFHIGHLQKDSTITVFIAPSGNDKIEVYLTTETDEDILISNQFEVLNHGSFKIGNQVVFNGNFYDSVSKNTLTMQNYVFP